MFFGFGSRREDGGWRVASPHTTTLSSLAPRSHRPRHNSLQSTQWHIKSTHGVLGSPPLLARAPRLLFLYPEQGLRLIPSLLVCLRLLPTRHLFNRVQRLNRCRYSLRYGIDNMRRNRILLLRLLVRSLHAVVLGLDEGVAEEEIHHNNRRRNSRPLDNLRRKILMKEPCFRKEPLRALLQIEPQSDDPGYQYEMERLVENLLLGRRRHQKIMQLQHFNAEKHRYSHHNILRGAA